MRRIKLNVSMVLQKVQLLFVVHFFKGSAIISMQMLSEQEGKLLSILNNRRNTSCSTPIEVQMTSEGKIIKTKNIIKKINFCVLTICKKSIECPLV